MTTLNLNEASKASLDNGEERVAAVTQLFADKSDLLRAMRIEGMEGNAVTYSQEGELPTVAFRGVGESFVPNSGVLNTQTDSLKIVGGEVEIDRFDIVTQGDGVRSRQIAMKVKALAIGMTNALLTGSEATDPSYFDGLQTRITESSQKIANGSSSGGDPLSLAKLDRLIAQVNNPTHLIMNPLLLLRFQKAARSSTFPNILMDKDALGNQFTMYGNLPILTGYQLASKNTMLLPYSEANPGGGSAVGTSIYAVNLAEDGVVLRSNGGISVRDQGEMNDAPTLKTRIEWYVTPVDYSQYARARLYGIADADVVN